MLTTERSYVTYLKIVVDVSGTSSYHIITHIITYIRQISPTYMPLSLAYHHTYRTAQALHTIATYIAHSYTHTTLCHTHRTPQPHSYTPPHTHWQSYMVPLRSDEAVKGFMTEDTFKIIFSGWKSGVWCCVCACVCGVCIHMCDVCMCVWFCVHGWHVVSLEKGSTDPRIHNIYIYIYITLQSPISFSVSLSLFHSLLAFSLTLSPSLSLSYRYWSYSNVQYCFYGTTGKEK